jgi:uncharacterized repeat protein (TIGR04076 family)
MNNDIVCNFALNNGRRLVVENCEKPCRYHKAGNYYDFHHIVPPGLCPEAFHAIYPQCLGLLYKGDFGGLDSLKASCPKPDGVVFEVKRIKQRSFWRRGGQVLRKLLSKVYPAEVLDYDIKISPVEIKGNCDKNIKIDTEYYFNLYNTKELCPAAFDSLFPFVFTSSFVSENNIKTNRLGFLACPDHKTNIVFQLFHGDRRLNTDYAGKNALFSGCSSFQDIQIKTGACASSLKECLPSGLCYSLFHNVYPYYLTLLHKGYFGWMKDHSCVIAQCPEPETCVAAEIRRTPSGEVKLSVITQKGPCPKKITAGDTFLLKQEDFKLPFGLLRDISPYVNIVNSGISGIIECGSINNCGNNPINVVVSK